MDFLLPGPLLFAATCVVAVWRASSRGRASKGSGSGSRFCRFETDAPRWVGVHQKLATAWVLEVDATGRQVWREDPSPTLLAAQNAHAFDPNVNPNASDKIARAQLAEMAPAAAAAAAAPPPPPGGRASAAALTRGWDYYARLQHPASGHFPGDYGGPLFLTPCLLIACAVSGVELGAARRAALLAYLRNHQQASGGWGLHLEGPATLFASSLAYAALRASGVPAGDPAAAAGRAFLRARGGAAAAPFWAKFWLALLGAYDWEGVLPLPPELFLLPAWAPFHPGNMWCHSRMLLLPMAYCYGARVGAGDARSPLALALRAEMGAPATPAEAAAAAWRCAPGDLYVPPTALCRAALGAWRLLERWAPRALTAPLREAALRRVLAGVDAEDAHTGHLCIGPVSKALHLVVVAAAHGRSSPALAAHVATIGDYLWVAEDGMKVQGYNGSQLWDAAFAAQALAAAPPREAARRPALVAGLARFLAAAQVREDAAGGARFHRDPSVGGWPFSTRRHGWPIADCTAEALKAALALGAAGGAHALPRARLTEAARLLLALGPNADGGWATYERKRGGDWYESLNASQVFGDIMVDYTYTELTSAAVTALAAFARCGGGGGGGGGDGDGAPLASAARAAVAEGLRFLRANQRADGSWYGSWGVCFLYGTLFGVSALAECGEPRGEDAPRLAAAAAFVLRAQREDGGWGESYRACVNREPEEPEAAAAAASNAVSTAWALLALMRAGCGGHAAVQRGVERLLRLQEPSGDWPQGPCSGVFNRTCAITYSQYRNVFPLWALGEFERGGW
jgi:squalene/oxidosqualene cyclase-like protein